MNPLFINEIKYTSISKEKQNEIIIKLLNLSGEQLTQLVLLLESELEALK